MTRRTSKVALLW